jgi:tricarballylate dehydrogenase
MGVTVFDEARVYDVLVIGGGNAGLCAAITAREHGLSVLLLESAPVHFRGGNSRHTRNMRTMHEGALAPLSGAYPEEEYWEDLFKVTGGLTDERLARMAIRQTAGHVPWMQRHGVRFQAPLGGTLQLGRTNAFFLGGGKALVNAYYRAADALGVDIAYDSEVVDLDIRDGRFVAATVKPGTDHGFQIRATALVAAAGGFESNLAWLREAWGEAADNFLIRGTPYNMGKVLRILLDKGAKQVSDATAGHCVAIDARSPKFDGGIVTRVDAVTLGIVVNKHARRFSDEGEDYWPKRYAIWGRLIAGEPDQIAYSIIDAKSMGKFMPPVYPPLKAGSIGELATKLGLDRLRPGITFTYLGVAIDPAARMVLSDGKPAANIFAAGEIMAGNVLGKGYLAGIGMAIGTTFGRIAGEEAARLVQG